MSNIPERILEFIEDAKKELVNKKIGDNYCVMLYATTTGFISHSNSVKAIYKNIDDFLERGESAINKINPSLDVNVQIWEFD